MQYDIIANWSDINVPGYTLHTVKQNTFLHKR